MPLILDKGLFFNISKTTFILSKKNSPQSALLKVVKLPFLIFIHLFSVIYTIKIISIILIYIVPVRKSAIAKA